MSAGSPYGAAGGTGAGPAADQCPVRECARGRRFGELMCAPHWRMLPRPMQRAVYRAWGDGAGAPEHQAACKAAIAAVERRLEANR